MGLAPAAPSIINSIPPMPNGGNLGTYMRPPRREERRTDQKKIKTTGASAWEPRCECPGCPGAQGRPELTRSDCRYYPVKVAGGLLSMGDTHLAQGDSELDGTGIETSLNGKVKISLLKKADLPPYLEDLSFPLLENENEYVVHGFTFKDYIKVSRELGPASGAGAGADAAAPHRSSVTTRTRRRATSSSCRTSTRRWRTPTSRRATSSCRWGSRRPRRAP